MTTFCLLLFVFGNDAGDERVAFAEFYRFSGAQPGLEFFGVAELAHVDGWHEQIVTHNVSHRR